MHEDPIIVCSSEKVKRFTLCNAKKADRTLERMYSYKGTLIFHDDFRSVVLHFLRFFSPPPPIKLQLLKNPFSTTMENVSCWLWTIVSPVMSNFRFSSAKTVYYLISLRVDRNYASIVREFFNAVFFSLHQAVRKAARRRFLRA